MYIICIKCLSETNEGLLCEATVCQINDMSNKMITFLFIFMFISVKNLIR